jgi:tRNA threonylcarbamoyladenosine biosynthesis protein TsaE
MLGRHAAEGTVIALTGDLGSGKTAFTQGLAGGIGIINDYVTSPSYTLINHYSGNGPDLFHIDLYRLTDSAETRDLGLDEILHHKGVVVIEWAEKFGRHFWQEDLEVQLKIIGDTDREISLTSYGPTGDNIMTALGADSDLQS